MRPRRIAHVLEGSSRQQARAHAHVVAIHPVCRHVRLRLCPRGCARGRVHLEGDRPRRGVPRLVRGRHQQTVGAVAGDHITRPVDDGRSQRIVDQEEAGGLQVKVRRRDQDGRAARNDKTILNVRRKNRISLVDGEGEGGRARMPGDIRRRDRRRMVALGRHRLPGYQGNPVQQGRHRGRGLIAVRGREGEDNVLVDHRAVLHPGELHHRRPLAKVLRDLVGEEALVARRVARRHRVEVGPVDRPARRQPRRAREGEGRPVQPVVCRVGASLRPGQFRLAVDVDRHAQALRRAGRQRVGRGRDRRGRTRVADRVDGE